MNGFNPDGWPAEKILTMTAEIVKESEAKWQYTSRTVAHESMPELDKVYYVHSDGTSKTASHTDSALIKHDTDAAQFKKILDRTPGAHEGVQIKLENLEYHTCVQDANILKSAKVAIEKYQAEALDLKEDFMLQIHKRGHKEFEPKVEELNTAIQGMMKFLDDVPPPS